MGGYIEIEFEDRKFRIEDVKNVIFVVMREGIVLGGGVIYIYFLDEILRIKKNVMEDLYE